MPTRPIEVPEPLPAAGDTERLKERYGFDTLAARAECLRLAEPIAGMHVLDVGTGSGLMAAVLARSGALVTSIDINFQTMVRARDRLSGAGTGITSRIRLVVADALSLPFPSDSFDALFSFDSIHHVADCRAATDEMERVLRPGGRLVVADLNPNGLSVIRSLNAERGETHQENGCRLERLGRILRSDRTNVDRHDYDFVSIYVKQKPKPSFPNTWTPLAAWATDVEERAREGE